MQCLVQVRVQELLSSLSPPSASSQDLDVVLGPAYSQGFGLSETSRTTVKNKVSDPRLQGLGLRVS